MRGSFRRRGCKCPKEKKRCTCGAKWYYRYDVIDPVSGKRRQKEVGGFRTKADAEEEARRIQAELHGGTYVEEKDITFYDFSKLWLKLYIASGRAKQSTIDMRVVQLNRFYRYFKDIKLRDITLGMYQDMLNDLLKTYARKTVMTTHECGMMMFEKALELGIVSKNITEHSRVPLIKKTVEELESQKQIPKYLEKEQLAYLLKKAKDAGNPMDYPLFLTLAYTGLRLGEITALKWSDIDFEEQTISVTKNIYKGIIGTPKTRSSVRIVDIDQRVVDTLKKYQMWQNKFKMKHRDVYNDQNYVFIRMMSDKGKYIAKCAINNRAKRLLKGSNINFTVTAHTFRHTHTSLLAEAGVPLDMIMRRLGHESDKVTRLIYLHVTKGMRKESSEKFARLMDNIPH